jgi:hypothetical protein
MLRCSLSGDVVEALEVYSPVADAAATDDDDDSGGGGVQGQLLPVAAVRISSGWVDVSGGGGVPQLLELTEVAGRGADGQ